MQNNKSIIKNYIVLIFAVLLLVSCATVTHTTGALDTKYHPMLEELAPGERTIGSVSFHHGRRFWYPPLHNYQHTRQISTVARTRIVRGPDAWGQKDSHQNHPSASSLDRLIELARVQFPGEGVVLRKTIENCRHSNIVRDGQNLIQCEIYYVADIVVNQPMPRPVLHLADISISQTAAGQVVSVDGSVIGQISIAAMSRADLYRRAHNFLTDTNHRTARENVDFQTITFDQADIDLGRIRGVYTFIVERGQQYRITSTFTIDVHDARAQIRFEDVELRRPGSNRTEPIFLQSIADLVKAELERFTGNMISSIT
jgi:hypothetical protein